MVIHDGDRILHMSQGWSDVLRLHAEGHADAVRPGSRTRKPERTRRSVRGVPRARSRRDRDGHGGEWTITTQGGERTHLGILDDAARRRPGQPTARFVTMAVDVTERKKAEADLRTLNEGLEQRIANARPS